jgi:hypothetical protein
MVTLPDCPRRATLISFWMIVVSAAGLLSYAAIRSIHALAALPLAASGTLVIGAIGWARPRFIERIYDGWNTAASLYARGARLMVQAVCYVAVFGLIGRAGSRLPMREPFPNASAWRLHPQLPTAAYFSSHVRSTDSEHRGGWIRRFAAWTWQTGHLWPLSVLPFFLLLDELEPGRRYEPAPHIYTLY